MTLDSHTLHDRLCRRAVRSVLSPTPLWRKIAYMEVIYASPRTENITYSPYYNHRLVFYIQPVTQAKDRSVRGPMTAYRMHVVENAMLMFNNRNVIASKTKLKFSNTFYSHTNTCNEINSSNAHLSVAIFVICNTIQTGSQIKHQSRLVVKWESDWLKIILSID